MESKQNSANEIWERVYSNLGSRIDKGALERWLGKSVVRNVDLLGDTLSLHVPNDIYLGWITDNFLVDINLALRNVDSNLKLQILKSTDFFPILSPEVLPETEKTPIKVASPPALNPRYTFENFVSVRANSYALSVAREFANQNPLVGNSLFFHSPPGWGKTHLTQAIASEFYKKDRSKKIVFASTESIFNNYISAIINHDLPNFRKKLRFVDLLALDDFHFLGQRGKEATIEEFFNMLNDLDEKGAKMVFASNYLPGEMEGLPLKLLSRLSRANLISLEAPSYEDRVEIIQRKIDSSLKNSFTPYMVAKIAQKTAEDIRTLEGLVISASAGLSLGAFNDDEGFDHFMKFPKPSSPKISFDYLIDYICKKHAINPVSLKGDSKIQSVVGARQELCYLAHTILNLPYAEIGRRINRNHATVMHSLRKVESEMGANKDYAIGIERTVSDLLRGKDYK